MPRSALRLFRPRPLSFNDSGIVLGELLGTEGFEAKVKGLSRINLVQQGGLAPSPARARRR